VIDLRAPKRQVISESDLGVMQRSLLKKGYVGFEVLIAVIVKSIIIFWDITPCSPLKINGRIRGTYLLHFQGRRISWARNQEDEGDVSPKCRLTFNGLHCVISQKRRVVPPQGYSYSWA
jgi:hypothetical protein